MRARSMLIACLALTLIGCQGAGGLASEEAKDSQARVDHFETAAVTYYDGGKYAEAERMFAAWLQEKPGNKKARRGLARSKMMQGGAQKLREAEEIFVELVELPWHHAERGDVSYEVESDLATTYMQLADLYDRDVRSLDDSLRNDDVIDGAETRRQLQQQVQKRNELLYKALPLWSSVLRKNPRNPYALSGLAKGNLQLGNDLEGIRYARDYLQLSRESQVRWRRELASWEERVGEENVTRGQRNQLLAKAYGARQKEKLMHLLLASVFMRRQEYREAVGAYTDVIKIDSAVPAAFIERAQAYGQLREYALAIDDIEQYLKITDPQMHRNERVNAGELLTLYRRALNRGSGLSPRGAIPSSGGRALGDAVPRGRGDQAWGGMAADPSGFPAPADNTVPGGFPEPSGFPKPNDVPVQPSGQGYPAPPPPNWPEGR